MKTTVILSLVFVMLFCGDQGESSVPKPEKVHRIVYEMMPDCWYKEQENLWYEEIQRNPSDAEAWHNYYNACRYASFDNIDSAERQKKLSGIIADMAAHIPDTYEYYLLKHWNGFDIEDLSIIKKAYDLHPERPETYYPFISNAEIFGKQKVFNEFNEKLYQSRDISPSLLNYNYNVLMSLEKNAVLFTNGDNDTYPVWMLQTAKEIRPDVLVINVSMAPIKDYMDRKLSEKGLPLDVQSIRKAAVVNGDFSRTEFISLLRGEILDKYPETPIYYASTVYDAFTRQIKDDLYIVGLTQRFSEKRFDNISVIKDMLENKFYLDYLNHDWYREKSLGTRLMSQMNMNYTVPMIMLGEYYGEQGDKENARRWLNFALDLARQKGDEKPIKEIEEKLDAVGLN